MTKPAWMCAFDGCTAHKHVSNGGHRRPYCAYHLTPIHREQKQARRKAEGRVPMKLVIVNSLTGEGECIQTVTAVIVRYWRKPIQLPDDAEGYMRTVRQLEAEGYQVVIATEFTTVLPEVNRK